MSKPEPLKGKMEEDDFGGRFSNGLKFRPEDIRSAVEYHRELERLIEEATNLHYITVEEYVYWHNVLIYEEAFEDVMK